MMEFSWRTRGDALRRFSEEEFDILIIGGGITGAGLALDGAARGLRVALAEKRDFAAGTSSRSTKLIHGGLRYLEHLEFALVREGLRERALLLKNAPHLAEPFPFLIPVYREARRNYDRPWKIRAGLFLYDFLAGSYRIGRHRRLRRDEALRLAPQLDARGLKGALVYYDCLTNDSRLVIEVLKTAGERGAVIANYANVCGFLNAPGGRLAGARVKDEFTDREVALRAKVIINAAGVWVGEVGGRGKPGSGENDATTKQVRPSKGVHVTVAAERLRVNTACLIPSLTGHRFYFVVPWQGRVNIGTTDTDYQGDKDAPRAEAIEINEILEAINSYFPDARLTEADVISSWAGLRPLIADASGVGAKSTTEVSRKEEIFEDADGLITVAGGKLTTYRLMAERGIDLAARRLKERFGIQSTATSPTKDLVIGGGALNGRKPRALAEKLSETENLPLDTALHLANSYSAEAFEVCRIAREAERLRTPLLDDQPHLAAEVIYATRREMALTVADVMARRTRLLMTAGEAALKGAEQVASLMAAELGWGAGEVERQVAQLTAEYEREYTPS